MTIDFENETEKAFDFDCERIAGTVMEKTLDYFHCPYEAEISLVLTDNEGIREINRQFRKIDAATDVLSFPALEYESPADFTFLEESADAFNPDTGELMLGDMMISVERVASQAEEYGHSELREYAFLIVHSMLHLLGFDHMEEDERLVMEDYQRKLLEELEIRRED